jgi:DNA-binding response OmpR family regulator
MHSILICDDQPDIVNALKIYLTPEGYRLYTANTGAQAVETVKNEDIQLVLLDIMMPVMDVITAAAKIREFSNVPIIFLTAKSETEDVVLGLNVGADDYITKPFSLAILRARVNAQLRRERKGMPYIYQSDPFLFNFDHMDFQKSGMRIELSKTEQKLLRILLDNRGMTVSRAVLVDRIWSDGAEYVDENALSVTMKRLRDKLEDDPSQPTYLKTIYGLGYTWAVK